MYIIIIHMHLHKCVTDLTLLHMYVDMYIYTYNDLTWLSCVCDSVSEDGRRR